MESVLARTAHLLLWGGGQDVAHERFYFGEDEADRSIRQLVVGQSPPAGQPRGGPEGPVDVRVDLFGVEQRRVHWHSFWGGKKCVLPRLGRQQRFAKTFGEVVFLLRSLVRLRTFPFPSVSSLGH